MEGWGGLWENWELWEFWEIWEDWENPTIPKESNLWPNTTVGYRFVPAPQGGFALAPTHGYSDKGFLRNRWDFLIIPILPILPNFPIFP